MNWSDRIPGVRLHRSKLLLAAATAVAAGCAGAAEPPARVNVTLPEAGLRATATSPDSIVGISRNELAACAVRAGGRVDCWGTWKHVQPNRSAQPLAGIDDGRQVVVGFATICVLRAGGVSCTDADGALRPVAKTEQVVAMSPGAAWCGFEASGSIRCWSLDDDSQPAEVVPGARAATALTSSRYGMTCAVERGGTVACRTERDKAFRRVAGLTGVRALALGHDTRPEPGPRVIDGCAIDSDGVRCFTIDESFTAVPPYQLGWPQYYFDLPERPAELKRASAISLTRENTLTATVDGSVVVLERSARRLEGLQDVRMIANGCALTGAGEVRCWGSNEDGQLGQETTSHRLLSEPVEVRGLTDVVSLAAGGLGPNSWAVTRDGRVFRWGESDVEGERSSSTPVAVDVGGPQAGVVSFAPLQTCLWSRDRDVACRIMLDRTLAIGELRGTVDLMWGVDGLVARLADGSLLSWSGGRYDKPVPLRDAAAVARALTGCAIESGGRIECRDFDGKRPPEPSSVVIPDAVELAGNDRVTCARRHHGKVTCWGGYSQGELGNGSAGADAGPHEIPGIDDATSVVVGDAVLCAIRARGRLTCWGHFRPPGRLTGRDPLPTMTPTDVFESGVQRVSIGMSHACALLDTGRVRCWGFNSEGDLGDGTLLRSDQPLPVPGL